MGRKVLVLNADYSAISLCTVPKAFALVYLNKAEMVAASDTVSLRTINHSFPMPSVIRLNKYINVPYKGIVLTRQNVFKRDGNSCSYCGTTKNLTLDHVIPKSKGGKTNWLNLTTACQRCNSLKGSSTPEEAKMPLKNLPYKPTFVMLLEEYAQQSENKWQPYLANKKSRTL